MEHAQSFHGSTASEAMAAVKRSLGEDAVIITLRERPGDPQRRYEIDATRGEPAGRGDTLPLPALSARRVAPGAPRSTSPTVTPPATREVGLASPLLPPLGTTKAEPRPLEQLERAGLDPLVKTRLVERALRLQRSGESSSSALRTAIGEVLTAVPAPWQMAVGQRRVIGLVGPTGAGKTTTLAKIAAQGLLAGRRVALITTDTWRVGAAQHLTRYGEIMGVPSYVVVTEKELAHAVQHARGHDLILIDTAGRSPRSLRDPVSLRGVPGIETHLVVPVGLSSSQLASIRQRHRDDDVVAMICTKLDETEGLQDVAGLMNAAATLGLPLSATSDGQGVPDDVTAFDSAALWRRLGGAR